jgi:regulator of sirC expression with transglutaminase-like and TPR domain
MQSQCTFPIVAPADSRRAALITLLSDEDPAVYRAVRQMILSCGNADNWLHPFTLSDDPLLRRRAREIIRQLAGQAADMQFLGFCLQHGEWFDIERAAWMLSATAHPDRSVEGCEALLDEYAAELRARIGNSREPEDILGAMNLFLFEDLGFHGNANAEFNLQDLYLLRVLERRAGDAVNLCLIYLLLGHRLQLPLAGIAVPGYFLCRYQSSSGEVFVDVCNSGRFLTRADCLHHLMPSSGAFPADVLEPASARRILLRVCENLHLAYIHHDCGEDATRIRRYLVALRG